MQEQNFERQVKNRMEEFSIPPSRPVWQKVERDIRKKRERRRMILWMLPLLLIGSAALVYLNSERTGGIADVPVASTPNQENYNHPIEDKGDVQNIHPLQNEKDQSLQINNAQQPDINTAALNKTSNKVVETGNTNKTNQDRPSNKIISHQAARNLKPIAKTAKTAATETSTIEGSTSTEVAPAINSEEKPTKQTEVKKPLEARPLEAKPATPLEAKPDEATTAVQTPENTEDVQKPSKKKWQISVQGSGGIAHSAETLFPITSSATQEVRTNSVGGVPSPGKADQKRGNYYSAGIHLSKPLNHRIKLNTGIHYSFGSTKQEVGSVYPADSTPYSNFSDVEKAYRNGRGTTYNNQYHFLEIPVGIELQVFSSLPIELNTGFALSRMIYSNALHYNELMDNYYVNDEQLRKTGISWYSGFSYAVMKERLKFGPHLQYGLVSLHKSGADDKKYLLMAGLKLRYSIN